MSDLFEISKLIPASLNSILIGALVFGLWKIDRRLLILQTRFEGFVRQHFNPTSPETGD